MAKCVNCIHNDVCVRLGKPALYGINKELGCDKYLEVVRCKDCESWNPETGFCKLHSNFSKNAVYSDLFDEDDFCSFGKRKEGAG